MSDVYQRLRERLDQLSTGYPATASGVEIRILKKLFTAEDAALFLHLNPTLESPGEIASRLSLDPAECAERLEGMAKKGLLFRLRKGGGTRYSAAAFVVGILEFQLNNMDGELARDIEEYHNEAIGRTFQGSGTPLVRTIPLNREVAGEWPIASYDDAMEILDSQKTIMVTRCICRTWGRLVETGCTRPLEVCFTFGSLADYYVENGLGRYVDPEEAKAIIRQSLEEHPFVVQISNGQRVGGMCLCCGDCCGMLRSLKLQPRPADAVRSNYFALVDPRACTGCGTCADRCQMDAVSVKGAVAEVDRARCIGCGSCVMTCAPGAVSLQKKTGTEHYTPPESMVGTYLEIARKRGLLPS